MRNHFLNHDLPWAKEDIGPVGNLPAMDDGSAFLCSAFAAQTFDPQGQGTKGNIKVGTYKTTADSLATVEASAYFSTTFVSTTMVSGDLLVVNASDGVNVYEVTVSGTTVTIAKLPTDQLVTTGDSDVTLPIHGLVLLPTTAAAAFAMPDPVLGSEVVISKTGGTTTITTVIPSTTTIFFGNGTDRKLAFDAVDETVILRGQSATVWAIVSNVGSVAAASS